jgi:murein DD-endopeptidase MepM/ murein hydrolase activator NlpD
VLHARVRALLPLASIGLSLLAHPASAEDAVPGALTASSSAASASVIPDQEAAAPPRVFIDQPVGTVAIGQAGSVAGSARYAQRSGGEGSGVVRFSSRRPSIYSSIAAATGPVAGTAPNGLPIGGRLTSTFGHRINPVSGRAQTHAGVDLAAATGSAVATTGDGVVRFAGAAGNYGLLVVVDHGGGMESRYAHLSRIGVAPGQRVTRGQVVGLVGSTGRSTGPHLHYEVRSGGQALNPLRH